MKALVVYYSRTGTTRKVAEAIASGLKAHNEEIIDKKDRKGPIGYVIAGKDASQAKGTDISEQKHDLKDHDTIIIGTPIWAWTITPAIRTYLEKNKDVLKKKKLGFYCTMGGSGDKKAFAEMERIIGAKPKATLTLLTREVVKGEYEEKVEKFLKGF